MQRQHTRGLPFYPAGDGQGGGGGSPPDPENKKTDKPADGADGTQPTADASGANDPKDPLDGVVAAAAAKASPKEEGGAKDADDTEPTAEAASPQGAGKPGAEASSVQTLVQGTGPEEEDLSLEDLEPADGADNAAGGSTILTPDVKAAQAVVAAEGLVDDEDMETLTRQIDLAHARIRQIDLAQAEAVREAEEARAEQQRIIEQKTQKRRLLTERLNNEAKERALEMFNDISVRSGGRRLTMTEYENMLALAGTSTTDNNPHDGDAMTTSRMPTMPGMPGSTPSAGAMPTMRTAPTQSDYDHWKVPMAEYIGSCYERRPTSYMDDEENGNYLMRSQILNVNATTGSGGKNYHAKQPQLPDSRQMREYVLERLIQDNFVIQQEVYFNRQKDADKQRDKSRPAIIIRLPYPGETNANQRWPSWGGKTPPPKSGAQFTLFPLINNGQQQPGQAALVIVPGSNPPQVFFWSGSEWATQYRLVNNPNELNAEMTVHCAVRNPANPAEAGVWNGETKTYVKV